MKDSEYVNIDELILTWFAWVVALFEWVKVALADIFILSKNASN